MRTKFIMCTLALILWGAQACTNEAEESEQVYIQSSGEDENDPDNRNGEG